MTGAKNIFSNILKLLVLIIQAIDSAAQDFPANSFLEQALNRVKEEHSLPGAAALMVRNGAVQEVAVSGVRKAGSPATVQIDDAFQIGSITKPITATLAFLLAEKKILSLSTRIVDVFPELRRSMHPAYRKVTVEMLLTHLAAFPYKPTREKEDEFFSRVRDLKKRRYEYVKAAVRDRPEGEVGKHFVYSGGSIIVAAMMEKKTKKSWEQLAKKYIFSPLAMASAGFGSTSEAGEVTGVWEHIMSSSGALPVPPPKRYNQEVHAPAGRNVHISLPDLAKFMLVNFPYGETKELLSRASLLRMQDRSPYAYVTPGWFVRRDQWSDWATIYHNGDNGKSIATFAFSPKYEAGYIIAVNIAGDAAWKAVTELSAEIEAHLIGLTQAAPVPYLRLAHKSVSYGKPVTASNVFYGLADYDAAKACDGIYSTRWATDSDAKEAWLEIDLQNVEEIKTILLKEEFSPRVTAFTIEAKIGEEGEYAKVTQGTRIGNELLLLPKPFKARFVRLNLAAYSEGGPTISEFQLFREKISSLP